MRVLLTILALAVVVPMSMAGKTTEDPDPTLHVASAFVRDDTVYVPVENHSYDPIVVEVTAAYDDGSEVHMVQVVVHLAAKGTQMAAMPFHIPGFNPLGIIENPDPIAQMVVLGTALWDD